MFFKRSKRSSAALASVALCMALGACTHMPLEVNETKLSNGQKVATVSGRGDTMGSAPGMVVFAQPMGKKNFVPIATFQGTNPEVAIISAVAGAAAGGATLGISSAVGNRLFGTGTTGTSGGGNVFVTDIVKTNGGNATAINGK